MGVGKIKLTIKYYNLSGVEKVDLEWQWEIAAVKNVRIIINYVEINKRPHRNVVQHKKMYQVNPLSNVTYLATKNKRCPSILKIKYLFLDTYKDAPPLQGYGTC